MYFDVAALLSKTSRWSPFQRFIREAYQALSHEVHFL